MGGALLAKSNLQILPEMEEDDALDFTMDILHKSYVDENFHKNLETHGIEKIGAFVSTIKMNNKKYNGIELLGKSVGEDVIVSPLHLIEAIIKKILFEFKSKTGVRDNDLVYWRIYDQGKNYKQRYITSQMMLKMNDVTVESIYEKIISVLS